MENRELMPQSQVLKGERALLARGKPLKRWVF